ncbi:MAG: hypothetical protein D6770_05500 [Anaerolineae bacterium]|nr:MAG: hypothetical protein D6770_05500 [Anaerolineae bacterium]
MDARTLEYFLTLLQAASSSEDFKASLDAFLAALREAFIFDNMAIYLAGINDEELEIAYARAMGRGRSAEADAAWGEALAGQVIASREIILQEPKRSGDTARLDRPYLLGLPLFIGQETRGALTFVRFGGPPYLPEHVLLARLAAWVIAELFRREEQQRLLEQLNSVQQQMRLQEDFLATISHELRTPLGFIKGYTTTLLRQDTTWDEATRREFLTIIDEEATHLTELIENVLESARLQSGAVSLTIQPLRVDALLRDVTTRYRARYKDLEVTLDFEAVPLVLGDGARLSQVFENLFSNALKYAPGSPITITLRRRGDALRIAFGDRGPGVPPEHLPHIFDRFYRVPGRARRPGAGLGLYICKQIIQAHHGKIWAESTPGQGTTFFIELPGQGQPNESPIARD